MTLEVTTLNHRAPIKIRLSITLSPPSEKKTVKMHRWAVIQDVRVEINMLLHSKPLI